MNNVMVSIYVTTYNHENYIVRALDSILMQKTQYTYEVFVGEDCSTDNTRNVLQEWERKHPGKFQIIYRETNTYNTDRPNGLDLKLRCKGKYIICLEGDDFWTDPEKLEKQVTFLETHPEYYAVAHNCTVVGKDSFPNGETYPECKDHEYTLRHFASNILPGQLTTLLSRNYMTDEKFDKSIVLKRVGPGDRNIYFSIASQGKIYCMQESMSAYRHITTEGSSFSATNVYSYASEQGAMLHRLDFARRLGNPESVFCAEFQFFMHVRHAFFKRIISLRKTIQELNKIEKWYSYLPVMLKRDVRRYITHQRPYV
ncbi:MAG: glycosyltransferase [Clostridia bacterium]|nr:glycosyltransferase [Clostridia bacterium]